MKEMKCYRVTCIDNYGNTYEVGVITTDEYAAKHSAEYSLFEGSHIKTHAIDVTETDRI